jgi:1,4-dihydroxy-2-naphthoate octaprenyltransferase
MRCHSLRFTAVALAAGIDGTLTYGYGVGKTMALGRKGAGLFLEFRLIPVLLWSYTAVAVGTALAYRDANAFFADRYLLALGMAVLTQGYVTHAINEIYDWRSGTDRRDVPRLLSGGSRVLVAGLLSQRDLWRLFLVASFAVWALAAYAALVVHWSILGFVLAGYVAGVVYTLPPIQTAYRPLAGEFAGGFLGISLSVLGAYYIQTLTLTPLVLVAAAMYASVCVAMLEVHHYLDVGPDLGATPRKLTTVAWLGPRRGKAYTLAFASAVVVLAAVLAATYAAAFAAAAVLAAGAWIVHARIRPEDADSVTRGELRIIQLGIVTGFAPSLLLLPWLWVPALLVPLGYVVHLRVARTALAPSTRSPSSDPSSGPAPPSNSPVRHRAP